MHLGHSGLAVGTLPTGPFVLLDDARNGGRQRLYSNPVGSIVALNVGEVPIALGRLRDALAKGQHAAGYLSYDGGGWFGLFDTVAPFDIADLPDPAGASCSGPEPLIGYPVYAAMLAEAHSLITAGEVYQLNLTFQNVVRFGGQPLALYAKLREAAGAGWGAVVHDGTRWLLSFSPELFFKVKGRRIVARPMKGTERRGRDAAEDAALAIALAADPKQRAENLMIVDLLRNDIARVADPGSVVVPELFVVERYPTVLQMVSGVEANLAVGCDAIDALDVLFPCGSITGAPKRRAMQAIAAIEPSPRGFYTGTIGALDANGDAEFNVAIRTLVIDRPGEARLGLGSGIIADSTTASEWRECLAKGAFLGAGAV